MAQLNHLTQEMHLKLVYFGPAHAGKGTIIRSLHDRVREELRSDVRTFPVGGDTLLAFDFNPFSKPVGGWNIRLHVSTLSGVVCNPASWRMALKGVDGVMVVSDPDSDAGTVVGNLQDHLSAYGIGLDETPSVLQINKADTATPHQLDAVESASSGLVRGVCRSSALTGDGVLEGFSRLTRLAVERAVHEISGTGESAFPESSDAGEMEAELDEHQAPDAADTAELQVAVAGEISGSGRDLLRIPLEVRLGQHSRRLVVTVSLDDAGGGYHVS